MNRISTVFQLQNWDLNGDGCRLAKPMARKDEISDRQRADTTDGEDGRSRMGREVLIRRGGDNDEEWVGVK